MRFQLAKLLLFLVLAPLVQGQRRSPQRSLIDQSAKLTTDQQIAVYQKQAAGQPSNLHFQNLLASAYIQKVRDSTDFSYLDRASQIVESVLSSDAGNYEAMRLRSEIELERHGFAHVAEYSEALTSVAPEDPWNWGTLGDALMELGQYERASAAYEKMLAIQRSQASYNRLAYYRFVSGNATEAIELMNLAVQSGSPAPENTAWCLVELGNMYFKTGQLDLAERAFANSLMLFEGYHSANGGLGRVKAAQGKLQEAIDRYKRAQASVPLPDYAAALHALYLRAGKPGEAKKQLELIDVVDRLAQASGEKTNRNLAMIYADQGRLLDRALELVREELKVRQDVYTYDALAWVLYKKQRYPEAQEAMDRALKMGTPEPGFTYHAGMIAAALDRKPEASKYLQRALALNPKFDISQAAIAEKALARLRAQP
jgi:tetratricopeptide (TPR) repeat protein